MASFANHERRLARLEDLFEPPPEAMDPRLAQALLVAAGSVDVPEYWDARWQGPHPRVEAAMDRVMNEYARLTAMGGNVEAYLVSVIATDTEGPAD